MLLQIEEKKKITFQSIIQSKNIFYFPNNNNPKFIKIILYNTE